MTPQELFLLATSAKEKRRPSGGAGMHAQLPLALTRLASDGDLIRRAQARLSLNGESDNLLWVEGLVTHLGEPLTANIIIPPDSPLRQPEAMLSADEQSILSMLDQGMAFRSEITIDEAQKALKTMVLQPVDMRWDGMGHEREKYGTSNGVRGVVVEPEIRNVNELWIAFVLWQKDFRDEAVFLITNLPYLGMSIDLGSSNLSLSTQYPQTIAFNQPQFYGGAIMFRQLAADKTTTLGAIAEDAQPKETTKMDPEKILEAYLALHTQTFANLEASAAKKDELIESLRTTITESVGVNREAVKAEVSASLRAEIEAEHTTALDAKAALLVAAETRAAELAAEVTELTKSLEAEKALALAAQEKLSDIEAAQLAQTRLVERRKKLDEVAAVTDEEWTAEFQASLAAADDAAFENLVLRRTIEALKAAPGVAAADAAKTDEDNKGEREIRASMHASLKTTPTPSAADLTPETFADLTKAFARTLSN